MSPYHTDSLAGRVAASPDVSDAMHPAATGQPGTPGRIEYLDALRALAVCAVVMIHASADCMTFHQVGSLQWTVCNLFDSLSRWTVPLFVMISGTLFMQPAKRITLRTLYGKYIRRVVVLFFVWSSAYTLLHWQDGIDTLTRVDAMLGGWYHLWFLWMIATVYTCIPFLRPLALDETLRRYFLVVAFFFMSVLPYLLLPFGEGSMHQVFLLAKGGFPVGFSAYFVLGYHLSAIDVKTTNRKVIYLLGCAGTAFTFVATQQMSVAQGSLVDLWYDNFSPAVLCPAAALFVFFKYHGPALSRHRHFRRLTLAVSRWSLGIYLVHVLVLEQVNRYILGFDTLNALIAIPLIWLITITVSALVSMCLSKIPLIGRHVV